MLPLPAMPAEGCLAPSATDHIHLILQDDRWRCEEPASGEQLGGAEERIVQVNEVEGCGARDHLGETRGVPLGERGSELDDLDAPGTQRSSGPARNEDRDLHTLVGERLSLV